MNSLERVVAALNHKEADRVPVYPLLNGISRRLTNVNYKTWATDAEKCAEAFIAVTNKYDLDIICTLTDLSVEAADFGQKIIFPENEAAHPDYDNILIKEEKDYYNVKYINPRVSPRMSEHIKLCKILMDTVGSEKPVVAFLFAPLGILSMLRNQQNIFLDLYDCPKAVHCALEEITNTLIEYCDALIETGVHAIMFDTLFACQGILGKEMWKEFEGVYMKKIADFVHKKGCMVMIHNCGKGIYFDAQIESMSPEAISFLHIPDDCSNWKEVKEKYGSKTTLIGCVDPTWIHSASPEEVESKCREQIDLFAKDGGFILATGCEYPANSEFKNAEVMVETAKTYGKYQN